MSMKNGKSPRLDGIPCEFYNLVWECIGEDFYCLVIEVFSSGCISKILNQGLTLIPKNGVHDSIGA